ncbi:MAG: endonuclease III domain-containing protein [Verrucomicrobiae bacterium]|nr:endonuclease III domain-containing protein [Verrucomicrobiae bacterium]
MPKTSGSQPVPHTGLRPVAARLREAYARMRAHFGYQHWWPGETPFEVCVGAILTQNTAWSNVERAIGNLKQAAPLTPQALWAMPPQQMARLIRPAGYFNIKTQRLRAFLEVLVTQYGGNLQRLFTGDVATVRARLLAIHGIGRETADSMLLYAGGHLSFVVDAYTKRIFLRHGWWHPPRRQQRAGKTQTAEEYESLKALCESALNHVPQKERLDLWQDYHAQLVMVGKHYCTAREPRCAQCPLRELLPREGPLET